MISNRTRGLGKLNFIFSKALIAIIHSIKSRCVWWNIYMYIRAFRARKLQIFTVARGEPFHGLQMVSSRPLFVRCWLTESIETIQTIALHRNDCVPLLRAIVLRNPQECNNAVIPCNRLNSYVSSSWPLTDEWEITVPSCRESENHFVPPIAVLLDETFLRAFGDPVSTIKIKSRLIRNCARYLGRCSLVEFR